MISVLVDAVLLDQITARVVEAARRKGTNRKMKLFKCMAGKVAIRYDVVEAPEFIRQWRKRANNPVVSAAPVLSGTETDAEAKFESVLAETDEESSDMMETEAEKEATKEKTPEGETGE